MVSGVPLVFFANESLIGMIVGTILMVRLTSRRSVAVAVVVLLKLVKVNVYFPFFSLA